MNKLLPQNVRDRHRLLPQNVRDRHRLLPKKLVLLLHMDDIFELIYNNILLLYLECFALPHKNPEFFHAHFFPQL
jgi:hypothetical protein